jgi:ATP-dependent DNA helicase RecG
LKSEGVNKLFKVIEENPGKRVPHYALVLNIPEKTIERWIKEQRENNKIEFRGASKTGGYFSVDKENNNETL